MNDWSTNLVITRHTLVHTNWFLFTLQIVRTICWFQYTKLHNVFYCQTILLQTSKNFQLWEYNSNPNNQKNKYTLILFSWNLQHW